MVRQVEPGRGPIFTTVAALYVMYGCIDRIYGFVEVVPASGANRCLNPFTSLAEICCFPLTSC